MFRIYYVKINFKGVVNLVDALGGLDLDVTMDFCEQDSNRRFGKNEICLKQQNILRNTYYSNMILNRQVPFIIRNNKLQINTI